MSKFPARVHPILARKGNRAIIIRRGPSKSVCTIGWNRENDTFQLGQWFRGRIYERRCDLSLDGMWFIYFAMDGKFMHEARGSWTAISRTPYLKAVGFWPNGSGWNGGGLFVSRSRFWHNRFFYATPSPLEKNPTGLRESKEFPFHESYGGECPGVYYIRLQRDGWKMTGDREGGTVFEKPLPGGWVLEKLAHATSDHPVGTGCYFDTHRLLHPKREIALDRPDWEWAELDRQRLVWVEKGILYAGAFTDRGVSGGDVLHDFNDMHFQAIPAPY